MDIHLSKIEDLLRENKSKWDKHIVCLWTTSLDECGESSKVDRLGETDVQILTLPPDSPTLTYYVSLLCH